MISGDRGRFRPGGRAHPGSGSVDTTEAKISSDMPLPMPRWVMSSPIHISSAVPVVRVRTTSARRSRR